MKPRGSRLVGRLTLVVLGPTTGLICSGGGTKRRQASSQRDQRREWKDNYRRYNPRYNSRDRSTGPGFSFNVPPSFQKSDLPAARRWLAEAEEDLKAARKNFSAGFYNYAAYAARMVSLVELGFNF